MKTEIKPTVLCAPAPRSLDLIFSEEKLRVLHQTYQVVETTDDALAALPHETLKQARYIIGQPPISEATLAQMPQLRAVLNVESNLIDNMPYPQLFERGIHVLTTGAVFAMPVAELGLGLALDLARGITEADRDFSAGTEKWGGDGNTSARLLSGSDIGIIGYGDLGRALRRVLRGFDSVIKVHDPWLPPSILREDGVEPANLETVLSQSETIFVVAAVTAENQHFIDAPAFASMRAGCRFILLSRAEVVDFDAMMDAVRSGHIRAASDVFPQEPLPKTHPARSLAGLLRSAHRAGALDSAFKKMGDMVLEEMALMDQGLPPLRCKRAERETVARMRSKPASRN
ncbi:MAG: hydroxyacid dehydrogenase [Pseudomonadota bacterium]